MSTYIVERCIYCRRILMNNNNDKCCYNCKYPNQYPHPHLHPRPNIISNIHDTTTDIETLNKSQSIDYSGL